MALSPEKEFLKHGRSTEASINHRVLEAVVRQSGNQTALTALRRLERIEHAVTAWVKAPGSESDGPYQDLLAALAAPRGGRW
jgi:hypothetical protein